MVNKEHNEVASRKIKLGTFELHSPTLFASYRLGDFPTSGLKSFPWIMTGTEALLINAYDFTRRKYAAKLNAGWDSAKDLCFPDRPILVDSGAYYFRKNERISITPEDVLGIELKSKADVGVVLDHPFTPDAKDKAKRISRTIENTETMLRALLQRKEVMTLMPAIHGHTRASIVGCIKRLRNLQDKFGYPLLEHVGIGSLAPLSQSGQSKLAIDIVRQVRRELPDAQIHCFSMGSALMMLLAYYCGADTVDSQSWMVSAGFKLAQLPGHYVVRMGKREYNNEKKYRAAMKLFGERIARLASEEDYSSKDWVTGERLDLSNTQIRGQYVRNLVDLKSNEHVHNRACHNLWTYNFEVKRYRQALKDSTLDRFMASRLSGTRYEATFLHALRSEKATKTF